MSSEIEQPSGTDMAPNKTPKGVVEATQQPPKWKNFLRKNTTQIGMIVVFFGLWLFFILAAPETFLSPQIYYAFMATTPFFAIMALRGTFFQPGIFTK